jgi:hypothetical protein
VVKIRLVEPERGCDADSRFLGEKSFLMVDRSLPAVERDFATATGCFQLAGRVWRGLT